jgi:maltooligosyltrehalose trehalohydrolase
MREAPPHTTPAAGAFLTLGAVCDASGTEFRLWAPDARSVDLVLMAAGAGAASIGDWNPRPLARESGGSWTARFDDVRPGARYKFRLDGDEGRTFPDPASRFQPEGVHGPSQVVEPAGFYWRETGWRPPPLERLLIYELHVGTFSPEGTFAGAIARLPHLVDLGVTAIELMPVGDFPGDRNWGYDGVAIFAPARCYGTPDDLRALVDAAHRHGLAALLDVVYNHFGPDGAYANAFSPYYFTEAHSSPWGRGLNLDGPHSGAVRRFFIENAIHWVHEYRFDGLRLDATHALQDDGPRHFLSELTSTVRDLAGRDVVMIAEDHRNLADLLVPVRDGGFGLDAVWADDFHHQVRVHTAGDHEGYYAAFAGSIADIATTLRQGWFFTGQHSRHLDGPRGTNPAGLDPPQFVICTQNHDQIGNRADGARLHHEIDPAAYRALTALLLLAPQTPLLFMGQEWAATSPFLFFTDHEAELGRQVTEGRRAEFGSFAAFADPAWRTSIPDPQRRDTFERSRLDWNEASRSPHAGVRRLHRRLIECRRATPALLDRRRRGAFTVHELDAHTVGLAYDDLLVVARLSGGAGPVRARVDGSTTILLTTEDHDVVDDPRPPRIKPAASADGRSLFDIAFHRPGAVVIRLSRDYVTI